MVQTLVSLLLILLQRYILFLSFGLIRDIPKAVRDCHTGLSMTVPNIGSSLPVLKQLASRYVRRMLPQEERFRNEGFACVGNDRHSEERQGSRNRKVSFTTVVYPEVYHTAHIRISRFCLVR